LNGNIKILQKYTAPDVANFNGFKNHLKEFNKQGWPMSRTRAADCRWAGHKVMNKNGGQTDIESLQETRKKSSTDTNVHPKRFRGEKCRCSYCV